MLEGRQEEGFSMTDSIPPGVLAPMVSQRFPIAAVQGWNIDRKIGDSTSYIGNVFLAGFKGPAGVIGWQPLPLACDPIASACPSHHCVEFLKVIQNGGCHMFSLVLGMFSDLPSIRGKRCLFK